MKYHIAPCGMNCTLCLGFQREKKRCPGCFGPDTTEKPNHCIHCAIKNCEKRIGTYCYECESYPCTRLKRLDKRYRSKYGMSMLENLDRMREEGMDAFLALEDERWICGSCGMALCVHRGECPSCGEAHTRFIQQEKV